MPVVCACGRMANLALGQLCPIQLPKENIDSVDSSSDTDVACRSLFRGRFVKPSPWVKSINAGAHVNVSKYSGRR